MNNTTKEDNLRNSKPFRTHLWSSHEQVEQLTDAVLNLISHHLDKIKNKKKYQSNLKVVLLNLYSVYLVDTKMYLAYSRDRNFYKKNRYSSPHIGYDISMRIMEALTKENLIEETKIGFYESITGIGYRSRTRATRMLALLFSQFKLNRFMIGYSENEETIIMREKKDENKESQLVDYEDTGSTNRMRDNLKTINAALNRTLINIHLPDERLKKLNKKMKYDKDRQPIDFSRRKLRRIFNNESWEDGGRLYHGWWQEVPKDYRKYIEINNEKTIELDYSSLHAQLLYREEHTEYENGDPYILDGLEPYRGLVKLCFNIMLNSKDRDTSIYAMEDKIKKGYKKAKNKKERLKWMLPIPVLDLHDRIEAEHAPIVRHFYSGIGPNLQFRDSVIAEHLMLSMLEDHILILPIHDSFIVQASHENQLREEMKNIPLEIMDVALGMKKKVSELEEINQLRREKGDDELTVAGSLFRTPEEDEEKEKYQKYYEARRDWEELKRYPGEFL